MRRYLILFLGLCAAACGDTTTYEAVETDSETEPEGSDAPDAGDETDTETEAASDDVDTTPPPGELGDRCWIPAFASGHPNLGLPDCAEPFRCVGDKNDGWCTEPCHITGDTSEAPAIEGWCCGELGRVCDPTRVWMPPSMGAECRPRDVPLGEPCTLGGTSRCAPSCEGTIEVFETVCADTGSGRFCTHSCESHFDCIYDHAFEQGCCGEIAGRQFCLPEATEDCL